MHSRLLFALVAVSSLTIATARAQTTAERQENRQVQLPRPGQVGMIGLRLSDVTAEQVKTLKLTKQEGAVVASVRPNSPAATAGFHENDVVLQFDGERVRSAAHLTRLVAETPPGREVMVGVMREGHRTDLRVKPEAGNWFEPRFGGMIDLNSEEWREQMERASRAAREMGRNLPEVFAAGRGRLGVTVQELNGELAEYFGVKSGVLVASVTPESPAAKGGVKAGDVITAINGKPVATPGELVGGLPPPDAAAHEVTLTVVRDKREVTMRVTLAAPASSGKPARGQRI